MATQEAQITFAGGDRPATARVCAFLECDRFPSSLLVVTSGHVPRTTATLSGRALTWLDGVNPMQPTEHDAAAALNVEVLQHGIRRPRLVLADVGVFLMDRKVDDQLNELPCFEPAVRGRTADSGGDRKAEALVDADESKMITYFDGSYWHRFIVGGVVSRSVFRERGEAEVFDVTYYAEACEGTPAEAFPRRGHSGTPFYAADGSLHSWLSAIWPIEGLPPRVLLVPANVALTQLGKLPQLKGSVLSGFKAAESVGYRYTDMRERVGTVGTAKVAPPLSSMPVWGLLWALMRGDRETTHARSDARTVEAERLLTDTPGDAATDHRKKSD